MIRKYFFLGAETLEKILPDWCCGRREILEEKYRSRYGEKDWKGQAQRERRRIAGFYLLICLLFLPLLVMQSAVFLVDLLGKETELSSLSRPDYGEIARSERLKVKLRYQDIGIEEEITLKVSPKDLTEKEAAEYLREYKKTLPKKILGANPDTGHISSDLKLPVSDGDLEMEWFSEEPRLIDEKGQVNLLHAKEGQAASVTVVITFKNLREELRIPLTIHLPEKVSVYESALRKELKKLSQELERKGAQDPELFLPETSPSGAALKWSQGKNASFPSALFFFPLTLLLIFQKRYSRADRKLQEERQAMEWEFPEFINRMILLLSAGLVVGSALNKIVGDYEEQKQRRQAERKPLYEALAEVGKRVRETNAPLAAELSLMARASGIRELMRFSALLGDSFEKGTALVKKLEAEGNLIWRGRKKEAERKGRVAETKLTFPLAILLLVLVMITISPVLLDI